MAETSHVESRKQSHMSIMASLSSAHVILRAYCFADIQTQTGGTDMLLTTMDMLPMV